MAARSKPSPRNRPRRSNSDTERLIEAVEGLGQSMRDLHNRLLGNADLKQKGLTHEVDEMKTNSEASFKKGAEIMDRLASRMDGFDIWKAEQEKLTASRLLPAVETVEKSMFLGSSVYKLIGFIVAFPAAGAIVIWIIKALVPASAP